MDVWRKQTKDMVDILSKEALDVNTPFDIDVASTPRIPATLSDERKTYTAFQKLSEKPFLPKTVNLCPQDAVPVRTAKVHAQIRGHLLKQMLKVQWILGNIVLFHCESCNARFPTWHPDKADCQPDMTLDSLRTCNIQVHSWNTKPCNDGTTSRHATLRHGVCLSCHRSVNSQG